MSPFCSVKFGGWIGAMNEASASRGCHLLPASAPAGSITDQNSGEKCFSKNASAPGASGHAGARCCIMHRAGSAGCVGALAVHGSDGSRAAENVHEQQEPRPAVVSMSTISCWLQHGHHLSQSARADGLNNSHSSPEQHLSACMPYWVHGALPQVPWPQVPCRPPSHGGSQGCRCTCLRRRAAEEVR